MTEKRPDHRGGGARRAPRPRPTLAARLAPAGVALVLGFVGYLPALHPDRQIAGRDLFPLFYPLHRTVAAAQRGEVSLLRDPSRGGGMPLLPDALAQVAYPPGWIRALLDFDLGFALWFPLHAALAGVGAALLSRRLGASLRGACLAAAGAALAGPLLSNCRCPNLLAGAAWSGVALAGFVPAAPVAGGGPRPQRRWLLLSSLAVAMMLLAGGIEILLLLALAVGVAVPVWTWHRAPRPGPAARLYLAIAAATALGAAISAIHLIPCALFLEHTQRGLGLSGHEASQWAFHPYRALEVVVPGVTPAVWAAGTPLGDLFPGVRASYARFGAPLNQSVHLGLPVVLLALVGLLRNRRALGLGLAAALWLLVASQLPDGRTPAFDLLRLLPLYEDWRYPSKALLPFAVVVPALAGVGLARVPRRWRTPTFAAAALLLAAAPLLDRQVVPTLPEAWYHEPPPVAREVLAYERDAARPAGMPGRYLRLRPLPARAGFEPTRAGHREVLLEDLASLYGLHDLAAYGPFRPGRLDRFVATLKTGAGLDRDRLAEDAGVAHLNTPEGLVHQEVPPRLRLVSGRGDLAITAYGADRIEAEVRLSEPGRAYLAEAYDPGWTARLEPLHPAASVPSPVVPLGLARHAFLGLSLPAGQHRLVLTYRPRGLWVGLAVTCAGAVLWLLLLLAPARRP